MSEADFYQQRPSYWEQASDNLASWLGQPHLTGLDLVILLPLFPLVIIGIIVWMPWGPWVWKKVPKTILGPYLLYCAFAVWHFHANQWLILMFALVGVGVCAIALKEIHARRKAWRRPGL